MTLAPGSRLGPYEILAPLGTGGMGEVWRARDTKLGREVALKVLPESLATDPERLQRFEREAQLLASLNHPHIAAIYGVEDSTATKALVLELVEGETLQDRIARRPLPIEEALVIARQIAEALEAAHERGVIHRDLKPANVKLTRDGDVKVLDFGLAKALDPAAGAASSPAASPALINSPTLTAAGTQLGVILGTAAYMAPEQARGGAVDKRADIWAFGVVLYEMLSGQSLFAGPTISDTLAAVIRADIEYSRLPAATPAALRGLLRRCLERNPKNRLHDIADARIVLEELLSGQEPDRPAPPGARPTRAAILRTAALVAVAALGGVGLGALLTGLRTPAPARVTRLAVLAPDPEADFGIVGSYAISPDASSLVFTLADEQGTPRLLVRPLDQEEARILEGTEGATWPFWSPDASDIAFFSGGRLRRVPASGGAVRALCDAPNGRGGSWGSAGVIVFAPDPRSGLAAVAAAGGQPRPVTVLDATRGENSHRFPSFLSDGRHFLFIATTGEAERESQVKVGSLDDQRVQPLLESGAAAVFAAPASVVFLRDRALLAQRIDLRSFQLIGEPRLLDDQPETVAPIQLSAPVSCSRSGVMAYTPRDRRPTTVAWLGADGRLAPTRVRFPAAAYTASLGPDRRRLAVMINEPEGYANWIGNLEDGTAAQIVPAGRGVYGPIWNPAGTQLAGATLSGLTQIDPETGASRLFDLGDKVWRRPDSWSPDGRTLVLSALVEGQRYDLQTLTLGEGAQPRPYLATAADEGVGMLSHDGRWLAYLSDASGRYEIYVERFPERSEVARAGVTAGSTTPDTATRIAWRADDRELYFVGGDGSTVYATEVRVTPRLALGAPRVLHRVPREARDLVLVDDGRALVLLPEGGRSRSITIVDAWMNGSAAKR